MVKQQVRLKEDGWSTTHHLLIIVDLGGNMSKTQFTHLHSHTEASLADGLFGTKKWVKAIKERGFIAHAITDHGSMTNTLAFYHQMRAEKLTPIIGCEFYYARNPMDKVTTNRKSSHLILLAKNYDGYLNLLKLQKLSFTDGYYFKNRIGLEWLTKYSEGLICLTACQGGVLAQEVWKELRGEVAELEQRFRELSVIFKDDLYVEFQGHHTLSVHDGHTFDSQALINETLFNELKGLDGFKQIVTNDCHYILPEHAKIQKMIKGISWKQKKDESAESGTVSEDHFCDSLWLKNAKEVYESFNKYHEYLPQRFVLEGIKHTHEVFEKCKDFALPTGMHYLPKFRPKIDSKKFFKAYTIKLLKEFIGSERVVASKEDYIRRYKKELEVISKYGLEDYFLIVWDLVRYARDEGIATGLGRGSAAGCLISYLLGIVRVDPLEFDLLFERFLNENRCEGGELPDIDLDFESAGRAKIKKYIYDTYGTENVCEIGTYGRMKLKTSLLDFGKALNLMAHKDLQKITKGIDLEKDSIDDLEKAMEGQEALKNLIDANPDYGFAVKNIIGQMKSQSIHPAGVLIASTPIAEIIPVKTQKKTIKPEDLIEGEEKTQRVITSQPEDKYVIAEGLMKMDILGVKEYDIIKFVIQNDPRLIEAGFNLDNYVEKIMRLNKKGRLAKVWKLFCQGETSGVFQFSSEGMQNLLKMMQPRHMDDLIAANALYRPGCLNNGWHILYCDRKNGKEETVYVHEIVEKITANTFGVLVFQEQFMRIINELGGIDLVESDNIRSALGKKNKEKLAKYGPMFIEGASKHIAKEDAEKLWEQIIHASEYSFNKCLAGTEKFYRHTIRADRRQYSIGEMYKIKNDKEYALQNNHKELHQKYKHKGYGKAYSMGEDGRLKPNRIVDIRFEGVKDVYEVLLEDYSKIKCTLNHKFPTTNGIKKLEDCVPGDEFYVLDKYEKNDSTYRFGEKDNLPKIGQKGFQKLDYSVTRDLKEKSDWIKANCNFCQICERKDDFRKEIHHVDGDHGNQDWDNLILTCSSCHKKEHYKMGRVKMGQKGLLTKTVKIIEVTYIGKEEVYDVEMEAPSHNFLTDQKIVTCNSHSCAYSVLAFISQFLKIVSPEYFFAAHFFWNIKKKETEDLLQNKKVAQNMGVTFVLPHINESKDKMIVQGKKVFSSLSLVKMVGLSAMNEIIAKQPFSSFDDFHKRVNKAKVKYNVIQNLIFSGSFDEFGDRRELLRSLAERTKNKEYEGYSDQQMMLRFYECVGFYEQKIKTVVPGFSTYCITQEEMKEFDDKDAIVVGGIITAVRPHVTKKGDKMGFCTIEDLDEKIEVTVFPEAWREHRKSIQIGNVVEVSGAKSEYGGKQNALEGSEFRILTGSGDFASSLEAL